MTSTVLKLFAIAFLAFAVSSCRTATVYNVNDAPLSTAKPATMAQVEAAIKRAGGGLGWQMQTAAPGHIVARLPIRQHLAVVDIYYTNKDFSIKYKNSNNLRYDQADNTIHSNYNGWVQNLEKAIIAQTSSI
jgi:hypothetical protein